MICKASDELIAYEMNDESQEVAWVKFADVAKTNLHPSFANTWPQLLSEVKRIFP